MMSDMMLTSDAYWNSGVHQGSLCQYTHAIAIITADCSWNPLRLEATVGHDLKALLAAF